MNKKIKILSGLFSSVLFLPLVAASCNKSQKKDDDKTQSDAPNNSPESQNNKDKKTWDSIWNDSISGYDIGRDNDDYKEVEETKETIMQNIKNADEIKKIVSEYKDSFATFHTQQDFLDQINVFAKEKKIENLVLRHKRYANKNLLKDENGGKNKITLRLGNYIFDVQLGKVDTFVATKYYLKDDDSKKIIEHKEKNFDTLNKMNKKIVITQIGYSLENGFGKNNTTVKIKTLPKHTIEVPKQLPLKIESLYEAFKYLESERVENLNLWDLKNIRSIAEMFSNAKNFNQDISDWNTMNIRNMSGLFDAAGAFNKPLNKWNVSNVTQMGDMFAGTKAFNQDLNDWDTKNVFDMESMFHEAEKFNGKIDKWNVKNVKKMSLMFADASAFSHDLSKWEINSNLDVTGMFKGINYKFLDAVSTKWKIDKNKFEKNDFKK
ncbi:BspA family leucine-rich repeat surface protein [Metamycoplasma auris]|uniref:Surface protein n=1 Tax=Metamycoplasma auris TaxID=51363 RepID=A0A2W7FZ08_9BACT|nr:BspA family leucine-rich repeat surface protein [Metamycoplasma auris]PZV98170.1 surface protein [Metamycoplasma auris]